MKVKQEKNTAIPRIETHDELSAARDYEQELSNLYNALAESVLEMSDAEIEQEIRDEGRDPAEVAEQVRDVLLGVVEKAKR